MEKKFTEKQLSDLITKKKTTTIKNLIMKGSGNKVSGQFTLDEECNLGFVKK